MLDTIFYSMSHPDHGICIVLVYVDDIMVLSDSLAWIFSAKSRIRHQFKMTNFGDATSILGMDITNDFLASIVRLS
jgi:hypothetical protein